MPEDTLVHPELIWADGEKRSSFIYISASFSAAMLSVSERFFSLRQNQCFSIMNRPSSSENELLQHQLRLIRAIFAKVWLRRASDRVEPTSIDFQPSLLQVVITDLLLLSGIDLLVTARYATSSYFRFLSLNWVQRKNNNLTLCWFSEFVHMPERSF